MALCRGGEDGARCNCEQESRLSGEELKEGGHAAAFRDQRVQLQQYVRIFFFVSESIFTIQLSTMCVGPF